jgi:hypothetical protein
METPFQLAVRVAIKRIRAEASLMNRDPAWLADKLFSMTHPGSPMAQDVVKQACTDIINAEMEGDTRS